jgi:hypothetical protein
VGIFFVSDAGDAVEGPNDGFGIVEACVINDADVGKGRVLRITSPMVFSSL